MDPTLTVLDLDVLRGLVGGDEDVVSDVLAAFETESQTMVAELAELLDRGDAAGAAGVAHKLKSASRAVGALRLSALCEAIEHPSAHGLDTASARARLHDRWVELREACCGASPVAPSSRGAAA